MQKASLLFQLSTLITRVRASYYRRYTWMKTDLGAEPVNTYYVRCIHCSRRAKPPFPSPRIVASKKKAWMGWQKYPHVHQALRPPAETRRYFKHRRGTSPPLEPYPITTPLNMVERLKCNQFLMTALWFVCVPQFTPPSSFGQNLPLLHHNQPIDRPCFSAQAARPVCVLSTCRNPSAPTAPTLTDSARATT